MTPEIPNSPANTDCRANGSLQKSGIDPTKNTITDDPLDADHIEETELEGK